jgi:integrase/recombinase XerD
LRKNKIVAHDITEDVSPPKMRQKAPRIPTFEEIKVLLEQPNVENESGLRDRAILDLLYSSGLRASELCDLRLEDIGANQVRVSCGKRGKTRTVPMTGSAHKWVMEYVEKYRGRDSGFLFRTLQCKQIRRQLLCRIVVDYANKAGIDGVTTHTLRHACATHLLDHGADLRMIQEVLGHSTIASTQRYTHLSSHKIHAMFSQFHPRESLPD